MITRKEIEKLQSIVHQKASKVGQTSNDRTRLEFDEAINNLISAEKEYNEQRKTKEITYTISIRPIGIYQGVVTIWEDATEKEVERAIHDDCEFYLTYNEC